MRELPLANDQGAALRRELEAYEPAPAAVDEAMVLLEPIVLGDIDGGEITIARWVAQQAKAVEAGGDHQKVFETIELIDAWLADEFDEDTFTEDFEVVIEEALAFADWGTEFGPDQDALQGALGSILAR